MAMKLLCEVLWISLDHSAIFNVTRNLKKWALPLLTQRKQGPQKLSHGWNFVIRLRSELPLPMSHDSGCSDSLSDQWHLGLLMPKKWMKTSSFFNWTRNMTSITGIETVVILNDWLGLNAPKLHLGYQARHSAKCWINFWPCGNPSCGLKSRRMGVSLHWAYPSALHGSCLPTAGVA